MNDIRRQLDALLGADRNGDLDIKDFTDDRVCKLYLAGLCPHDLFPNTKRDLGPCRKIHSQPLKAKYDEAKLTTYYSYEDDLERFFQRIVDECDREVASQQRKLEVMEVQQSDSNDPVAREIKELEEQQAKLGEEGNVDEYMKIGQQIDQLKARRGMQKKSTENIPEGAAGDLIAALGGGPQQQSLKVCEVCGLYLSAKDTAKRLEDHYIGKLHTGFHIVRTKLEELKQRPNRRKTSEPDERDRGWQDRSRPGRRDYDDRDRGYQNRGGDRHRDRDSYDRRGSGDRDYRGSSANDRRDYYRGGDRDRGYGDRDGGHRGGGGRDYHDRDRGYGGGRDRDYGRRDNRDRDRDRDDGGRRDDRNSGRDYDRRPPRDAGAYGAPSPPSAGAAEPYVPHALPPPPTQPYGGYAPQPPQYQ